MLFAFYLYHLYSIQFRSSCAVKLKVKGQLETFFVVKS